MIAQILFNNPHPDPNKAPSPSQELVNEHVQPLPNLGKNVSLQWPLDCPWPFWMG
ncbi:MAG: hypothetical protein NVS1B11_37470 [Terriglobales bacterium]